MAPKPDAISHLILDRLIADGHGDARWADLVLAACEGAETLNTALDGAAPPRPAHTAPADGAAPQVEPPGAYLRSITVEGFRGIGPAATVSLTPGPGLTVIVGRNGSGKSSFAEGLELLLTNGNKRWDNRTAVWKDSWRCLHRPNPCTVRGEFAVEGLGSVVVERRWETDAELDDSTAWYQARGGARQPYEQLGWGTAIRTHRPLLPYAELGALFEKPSEMHDALAEVLGLGEFDAIQKSLQTARKAREGAAAQAHATLGSLLPRLQALASSSGDARAVAALAAVAGKKPKLEALAEVVAQGGAGVEDHAVAALRQAQVSAPTGERVREVAGELREAAEAVEQSRTTDAGRARALAELLDQALRFHEAHAGSDCPVCGTPDTLSADWRTTTAAALADLRERATAAAQAHARLDRALLAARQLTRLPLPNADALRDIGITTVAAAHDAVTQWNTGATLTDPLAVADHLTSHIDHLCGAIDAFAVEVRDELARREDLWRPLADELRAWLPHGHAAAAAQAQVGELKKAETWFKGVQADMRAERFRPIAEHAKTIWRQLRQQSNVELEAIALKGTATQRSVDLQVTVDGVAGVALGVMSQGELNALALSLFMPRASLAESPFRFMVIDDPVQSMDPSRVDGLAQALHAAAASRQVVVFTHDDRLAESIRRLLIPATIVEVTRRPGSVVEARAAKTPVRMYCDDAMAMVKTKGLPIEVQRRVVPNFCRSAVEAACMDVVRRRRLKSGGRHHDIEALLDANGTLRQRLALALFDDGERAGEVGTSLDKRWSGSAAVVRALNEGSHVALDGSLEDLVRESERLAQRIGQLP
jgi:recombinational DNA repair ATPase RecF